MNYIWSFLGELLILLLKEHIKHVKSNLYDKRF